MFTRTLAAELREQGFIAIAKYHDFIRSLLWEFPDGKLQCIVNIGVVRIDIRSYDWGIEVSP